MSGALIVAIIGLCLAVASLAWQVALFLLSGSRAKVSTVWALLPFGNPPPLEAIGVVVRNPGRVPVSVTGWGLQLRDGSQLVFWDGLPQAHPLPHTLDPGHDATWYFPVVAIYEQLGRQLGPGPYELRGFARLGTGKSPTSDLRTVHPPRA